MAAVCIPKLESKLAEGRRPVLRVGVLLDSLTVPVWVHHILEQVELSDFANLVLVATVQTRGPAEGPFTKKSTPALLRMWYLLDRRWFSRRSANAGVLRLLRFTPRSSLPTLLECVPVQANSELSLLPPDREAIASAGLDVMLNFSLAIPDRELLALTRHGTWSFAHADDTVATLFWGLYEDRPLIAHKLNVASMPGKTGELILGYSAADHLSLFRNFTNSCWHSSKAMLRGLAELQGSGSEVIHNSLASSLRLKCARNSDVVRLLPRLVSRVVREQAQRRLMREQWFVAFRRGSALSPSASDEAGFTVIRPPRGRFYADPFVIEKDGKGYIFFEDYCYERGKAVISFIEFGNDGTASSPETAIEEDYHLSYPCLFQWEDEIYLLPETKNNRTIQLYRATGFPRTWTLSHVLLRGVAAVDSTLVHHAGKFWLFTSGLGTSDPWFDGDSELFLFSSDSLSGPWRPHPRNPVVADIRRSRCAGRLFLMNGHLIRPAQDCSTRYGYAVSLNRIDVLSPTDYRETWMASIPPVWMPGNLGTHTFNCSNSYEVLDGRTLIERFRRDTSEPAWEVVVPRQPIVRQF